MERPSPRGIARHGLGDAFEAEEARKSGLLLEARLLREQRRDDDAAIRFAEAARVEERLGEMAEAQGLLEKSLVHRFSAASCWAQAGNFFQAIAACDDLLRRSDLPDRLRRRVQEYADTLRTRRAQWYAGLTLELAAADPS